MSFTKLKNISFFSRFPLLGLLFLINACTDIKKAMVHDYPKEKAFVYDNKIVIKDPENKNALRELSYHLDNYWDDSLKVRKIRQFGVFNTIIQPAAYNPDRIERTIQYMQNYLATKGYHHPELTLLSRTDTLNKEWRVYLTMEVQLHKKTFIDTVTYEFGDKALQALAEKNNANSYISKGAAFSSESINNELDRLVAIFRSNGYYYFTKEKIFAEVDTMNTSLMKLNLDPLAQVNQIQDALKKSKENPSWKISFQLRNTNATHTKAYPIKEQIFYSDVALTDNPDTILAKGLPYQNSIQDIVQQYQRPKFNTKLFSEQSIIHKGDLFNEYHFFHTLNNLSALGAWQQIDSRTSMQQDSITLHYFLVPALRRSFSSDLEGSRNTAEIGAGNLLGLSTSFTYRDRNVNKQSIQSITSLRTGVELDVNKSNLTQTLLFNVGQSYSFPGLMIPFKPIKKSINSNEKTSFTLNGSYIDRLNYYRLKSFTTSWGYEWKKTKNGMEDIISYKPINIEFYQLGKFGKLDSLLILNPFLRSSFNNGNVISQTFSYVHTGPSPKNANVNNYLRIGVEEAGGLLGALPDIQKNSYRYIKAEIELRKLIKLNYTELAWRFMGGWGNNYSKDGALGGQLPFFKQFTAGGPYSMRAWGLRQLGLGSSSFYDTSRISQNFDRFGDLQLETNFEYRFTIAQIGTYKFGSALFADIGNIWNIRDNQQNPNALFKLDRLYKDLAIGIGTGIRFDFNYFIVRIDYALKMKDPTRLYNDGWLNLQNMKWTEIKTNGTRVNNYAWQFGIGLPF